MRALSGLGNKRLVGAISRSSEEWKKVGWDFVFRTADISIATVFETQPTGGIMASLSYNFIFCISTNPPPLSKIYNTFIDEVALTGVGCRSGLSQVGPLWRENRRLAEVRSSHHLQVRRQPGRKQSILRAWQLCNLDSRMCLTERSVMGCYRCRECYIFLHLVSSVNTCTKIPVSAS